MALLAEIKRPTLKRIGLNEQEIETQVSIYASHLRDFDEAAIAGACKELAVKRGWPELEDVVKLVREHQEVEDRARALPDHSEGSMTWAKACEAAGLELHCTAGIGFDRWRLLNECYKRMLPVDLAACIEILKRDKTTSVFTTSVGYFVGHRGGTNDCRLLAAH